MLKINENSFISGEKKLNKDCFEEEKYTCFQSREVNSGDTMGNYIFKNEMKKVDIFEKENFYRR